MRLVFIKVLHRYMKYQQNSLDSFPVNLYWKGSAFLLSPIHFLTFFTSLPALKVVSSQLMYLTRGASWGSLLKVPSAFFKSLCLVSVNAMFIMSWFHFCQALFVLWRGSGLNESTYFPRNGLCSCLDLLNAINWVTLLLALGSLEILFFLLNWAF